MTRFPWKGAFVAIIVVAGSIALAIDEGWSVNLAECRAGLERERNSQIDRRDALEMARLEPAETARRCEISLRPSYWSNTDHTDAGLRANEDGLYFARKEMAKIDKEIDLVAAEIARLNAEIAAIPEKEIQHPSKLRQFIAALFEKDKPK
jgi:hypothetical protein